MAHYGGLSPLRRARFPFLSVLTLILLVISSSLTIHVLADPDPSLNVGAPPPAGQAAQPPGSANQPAPAQSNQNPPPPQQPPQSAQSQQQQAAAQTNNLPRLAQKPECRADIDAHCAKQIAQLPAGEVLSDMAALECLQEAGFSEAETLSEGCAQSVWDYKIQLTQDTRFIQAIQQFCVEEVHQNAKIKQCTQDIRGGYALGCMMEHIHEIQQNSKCYQFLVRTERVAFSDYRLIGPFVEHCQGIVSALNCGQLTKMSAHQKARLPHSQGSTLECLIGHLVNPPRDQDKLKIVQGISNECRHQVMRIAELQSDDFHLDKDLFFACRNDREQFCSELPAGEGKVFQCLLKNKDDKFMHPDCARIISERAGLMGQDYRLAHPLTKACGTEMTQYRCLPQAGFEKSLQFHLSWVLLCLENGLHHYNSLLHDKKNGQKVTEPNLPPYSNECQHEMVNHRQMMVAEFRMSPELVMNCAQEIDRLCSPKGDLESEGKTVHCLLGHAQSRDKAQMLSDQCRNALQDLMKVADVGTNYKVDKVLYASCRQLIDGTCKRDAESEAATLTCLMKNLDGPEMTDDCEQRLVEVQYFMARDWTMDPQLYEACHAEAKTRCSAADDWNVGAPNGGDTKKEMRPDPGPQVLACLYRAGYDEEKPLPQDCANNVRRVLRERAARVNLLPGVEETCREALSEYCSHNVAPEEEMKCLQEHFESKEFKERYDKCHKELSQFTAMESKDTKLNRLLTRACKPVISTYCNQFASQDIDHGDVMECLAQHKDTDEMTPKCRSYVHHFELISLRDYHFSYRFTEACTEDINRYCNAFGQDKGGIIRCLSNIMFEHRLLGKDQDLQKDCKKQLKTQYLQQEKASFDDKTHMADADPELMRKCDRDIKRMKCLEGSSTQNFEDVVECLRVDFDTLEPDCKALIFGREKIEALDNEFDDELQKSCKYDIAKFCGEQKGGQVLDCLMNTKIIRLLQRNCQSVVQERMLERVKDDRLNPALLEACREDAQQYCPDDYRKVNDPSYAKQQLGSIIAYCLRNKYSQFGEDALRLSQACKDRVSEVILESEFDIHLDPGLYKACRATINDRCSTAILSKGGHFDNVLECLKAEFYQSRISNDDCQRQMSRRTQESLVDIHLDPGLHEACGGDIQRYCRDVIPGQSRIVMCLVDALSVQHAQLSSQCRNKLTEREKLWSVAHEKYRMALPENWSQVYRLITEHPARHTIITYLGLALVILLMVGCVCGRLTKRQHTELKNR